MGCLVGKIERIGGGLKGCIARTGDALSCGITLACEIRPALVRRIGDGLAGSVSRIGGLKANVSLVCAVNDTYSCFVTAIGRTMMIGSTGTTGEMKIL